MPNVRMPDGVVVSFPDNMAPDQIRSMIQSKFPDAPGVAPTQTAAPSDVQSAAPAPMATPDMNVPTGPAAQPLEHPHEQTPSSPYFDRAQYNALPWWQKPLQAADDSARLLAEGGTFGWADKAAAGMDHLLTGQPYDQALAAERAKTQSAANRAGSAAVPAELTGSVAVPIGMAGKGLSLFGKGALGAMGEGAGYGAVSAAGHDAPIGEGAALGAVTGLGGKALGDTVSGTLGAIGKRVGRAVVPTLEDLRAAGDAAAQKADSAGVIVRQPGVQKLADRFKAIMADHGAIPENEPGVFGAWRRLEEMAKEPNATLKGIYSVRKTLGNSFNPQNKSQNALATKMVNAMDEYINGLSTGGDVVSGNPKVAADSLQEMRDLWSRMRKLERAQNLVEKASRRAASTGAGANSDNATRQNLRQLLDNEKMGRGYTPDEQAALEKVVRGTPGQNALRLLGKMAPTGVVPAGMSAGMGATIGSHLAGAPGAFVGATVPPMIGTAAKTAADAITRGHVNDLMRLIASGGDAAAIAPNNIFARGAAAGDPIGRAMMAAGVRRPDVIFPSGQ